MRIEAYRKVYITYQITNKINGRYYRGKTNLYRWVYGSYKGSGRLIRLAYKKYGKENFDYEILDFFDCNKKACQQELLIVQTADKDPMSYNLVEGGGGAGIGKNNSNFGKNWYHNPITGKSKYFSVGDKIPEGFIKGKAKFPKHIKDRISGKNSVHYGIKHSPERRKFGSDRVKGNKHPQWGLRGKKSGMYGRKAYYNPETNKRIFIDKDTIIPEGFIIGAGVSPKLGKSYKIKS